MVRYWYDSVVDGRSDQLSKPDHHGRYTSFHRAFERHYIAIYVFEMVNITENISLFSSNINVQCSLAFDKGKVRFCWGSQDVVKVKS